MRCPACGECPFPGGVCEQRVNRGRRFFLMGALALPVARKIAAVASLVAPAPAIVTSASIDIIPVATPDILDAMHALGMQAAASLNEVMLRHIYRDALFPKMFLNGQPMYPAFINEPSSFPMVRG